MHLPPLFPLFQLVRFPRRKPKSTGAPPIRNYPSANVARHSNSQLSACPHDGALYTAYASFLIANHDFNEALPAIERGLKIAPQSVILHLRQGEALIALGNAPEDWQPWTKPRRIRNLSSFAAWDINY